MTIILFVFFIIFLSPFGLWCELGCPAVMGFVFSVYASEATVQPQCNPETRRPVGPYGPYGPSGAGWRFGLCFQRGLWIGASAAKTTARLEMNI